MRREYRVRARSADGGDRWCGPVKLTLEDAVAYMKWLEGPWLHAMRDLAADEAVVEDTNRYRRLVAQHEGTTYAVVERVVGEWSLVR